MERAITRRSAVGLVCAVVAAGVLALGACGGSDTSVKPSTTAAETPKPGGTYNFLLGSDPVAINPIGGYETEGMQVAWQVFQGLVGVGIDDDGNITVEPCIADKWETTDNQTWTFHLKKGVKFAAPVGTAVTAQTFVDSWNYVTDEKNNSPVSYVLAPIVGCSSSGYASDPAKGLTGVKALDDYTLQVKLQYPFADFEYVVAHPTLAPVPKAAVEKDPAKFATNPVGNGPFMVTADGWVHDQSINLVAFADYYGTKPNIDGIAFKIFKDPETAFLEFKAGNLDFTSIPSGQIKATEAEYGTAENGYTGNPGKQTLLGAELAIYYVDINTTDPLLKNADLRQAISLAINRQAICDTVMEGTRVPSDSIIPPGVVGYEPGAWPYSKYDVEAAKAALAKAGYPDGKGLPEMTLSCNSGGSHEAIMALIQADLKAVGINVKTDLTEWAAYLPKLQDHQYQIGRMGWIADYPIIDNFLYPIFYSTSSNNYSGYANPAVDKAITDARQITDGAARVKAYQDIVKTIGADSPAVPIMAYRHGRVTSDRVYNLTYSPMGMLDFVGCWIVQK